MKKNSFAIALLALISFGVKSQNTNLVSARLSFNQFELGYQRTLFHQKIWGETYIGLGNQDINTKYDDVVAGIRIGIPILANEKNIVSIVANVGLYFPNNQYYNTITPVYSCLFAYNRYFGKSKTHSLLVNLGYQYGNRDYAQKNSNTDFYTTTIGSFKVSPVYFSVGYGFHF
ncbi:MAG: hypothetical protein AUK44_06410 [Porphyromonadaceae bacterium CG2_30_38_12]|nr:MAG: hypothetical protein AUK44_06410 [Porphyromonadaceae bacterium CG2_30_38_12]